MNTFLIPDWWHHHGRKVTFKVYDPEHKILILANNAANLKINKAKTTDTDCWEVGWEIAHAEDCWVNGKTMFSNKDLSVAFGLEKKEIASHSVWLVGRFGCDRASQGKYIGFRDYLNIPGPGTGNDGNPNISIEIDDDMRQYVAHLLS